MPRIGTNLLFFEKGAPTKDVWFYEHRVPAGQKAYSMTKPIRVEHLQGCIDWWGGAERKGRAGKPRSPGRSASTRSRRAATTSTSRTRTPSQTTTVTRRSCWHKLNAAEQRTATLRDQLKAILAEALLR